MSKIYRLEINKMYRKFLRIILNFKFTVIYKICIKNEKVKMNC